MFRTIYAPVTIDASFSINTFAISLEIFNNEISWIIFELFNNFAEVKIIKGIVITHNKLIIAVSDIERATSPFAKEVSKFDVTPPGAAAIIITPIANSGDIAHIFNQAIARISAIIGSSIASKAIKGKIKEVVFDRNGNRYHGRVKAIADAAREAGLKF